MRVLREPIVERLRDMIAYAQAGMVLYMTSLWLFFNFNFAESITSETSLSPFDLNELSSMLSLIDQVKGQPLNLNL
jgi:hypothetical protein